MKKFFAILSIFLCIVIILGVFYMRANRVNMEFATEADVCFRYEEADIFQHLDVNELETLTALFHGKKLYQDNPSCGFGDNISIIFNNEQTFCIAQDTCPILYWKEKNKYIRLSEEEKNQLYNLLKPYGFFFPCV